MEKTKSPHDPRGLIYEAYRIDGISAPECRSVFLDWALGTPVDRLKTSLEAMLEMYGNANPDHPMTPILSDGLLSAGQTGRRGGRRRRNG